MLRYFLRYLISFFTCRPSVLWHWTPRRVMLWQRLDKAVLAIRLYSAALYIVPAFAVWFAFTHYGTPHVLVNYAQFGTGRYSYRSHCEYIGIYGSVREETHNCPFVTLIKREQ